MSVKIPIIPMQSVPLLDFRGDPPLGPDGSPIEAPLMDRAWWLFFNALVRSTPDVVSKAAVYMGVNGTLAIGSDLALRVSVLEEMPVLAVRANCKQAPSGANLVLKIYTGTTLWMTLTIAAGTTAVDATAAEIAAVTKLPAGTSIKLDITATGTTFPGSDLSVIVFV